MKKLFALLLAVALVAAMSVTAFAEDYNDTGDKGMNITYTVAPAYTVTIPETVTIDAAGTEKTVSAADVVVNKGQYVSVALAAENNFTVTTAEGATLTYTVTANGVNVAAGDEILSVNPTDGKTGSAAITFAIDEDSIQYAGTYTGTATFTVAVKAVAVTTMTFSIWGEPFTAEVGMTWAEWVASPYNDGINNYDWIFVADEENVWADGDDGFFVLDENGEVSPSDLIVADYGYWTKA